MKKYTIENIPFESASEACDFYEVDRHLFAKRISRGWTPEEALGVVKRATPTTYSRSIPVTVNGVSYNSASEAARALGIPISTFHKRLAAGKIPTK